MSSLELTNEELASLVEYFEILINIDQDHKTRLNQDD